MAGKNKILKQYWNDLDTSTAAFTSPQTFYRHVRKHNPTIRYRDVLDFLNREKSYYLYRPIRETQDFSTRYYQVSRCGQLLFFDTFFLNQFGRAGNFKALLVGKDCFSGYAFVRPMRRINQKATYRAIHSIRDECKQLGVTYIESMIFDKGTQVN